MAKAKQLGKNDGGRVIRAVVRIEGDFAVLACGHCVLWHRGDRSMRCDVCESEHLKGCER